MLKPWLLPIDTWNHVCVVNLGMRGVTMFACIVAVPLLSSSQRWRILLCRIGYHHYTLLERVALLIGKPWFRSIIFIAQMLAWQHWKCKQYVIHCGCVWMNKSVKSSLRITITGWLNDVDPFGLFPTWASVLWTDSSLYIQPALSNLGYFCITIPFTILESTCSIIISWSHFLTQYPPHLQHFNGSAFFVIIFDVRCEV
jgi:hypothetical protein